MNFKEMKQIVLDDGYFRKWAHGIDDGTKKNYHLALTGFCLATSKTPSELLKVCADDYHKPPWERKINDWFIDYDLYCESTGWSKDTYSKKKTYTKQFFRFNQIEVPSNRRGKNDKFKRANDRKLPTKEEIKLLLNACKTIKQKAIILTQFSSGLGNSDVVRLTVGQFRNGIDDNNICKIRIRRHKTDEELITFLSPEAVEAINSYLRVERNNLEDSQPLFTKYKNVNAPLLEDSILFIYSRLCDGLGWEKDGNTFRKITGHMGRKWLKTNLANAGMPREPLETILGHKLQGTDDNYYLTNEDVLKTLYMKYLPFIAINPIETITLESDEVRIIKEELANVKKELAELGGFREILKHPKVKEAMEDVLLNK